MMWRTQRVTMYCLLLCHIVAREWGLAELGMYSCFYELSNMVLDCIWIWLCNCMVYNNRLNLTISNMNLVTFHCCFELNM